MKIRPEKVKTCTMMKRSSVNSKKRGYKPEEEVADVDKMINVNFFYFYSNYY